MDYNKPSRISTEVNLYLKVIFFRLLDFFLEWWHLWRAAGTSSGPQQSPDKAWRHSGWQLGPLMGPCRAQQRPLRFSRGQLCHIRAQQLLAAMGTLHSWLLCMSSPQGAESSGKQNGEWHCPRDHLHTHWSCQERMFTGHLKPTPAPAFTP